MEEDLLPKRLPDKIRKLKWAKPIKAHGKASARSLTGPEAAEKEADKAETEVQKQMEEDIIEIIPIIPPGRKRTYTLIKRTPEKPLTPARAAPALPQSPEASSEASSPLQLPPSIAPAKLYIGKGDKERKKTTKTAIVKAKSLLLKSQSRE